MLAVLPSYLYALAWWASAVVAGMALGRQLCYATMAHLRCRDAYVGLFWAAFVFGVWEYLLWAM